jgi:hypothetical protein
MSVGPSPDPLAMLLGGGQVLLGPRGSVLVLRLLVTAMHAAGRDGITASADVRTLRTLFDHAATEARSVAAETAKLSLLDGPAHSDLSPSFAVMVDPIDCAEAARLLRCSPQWIRCLCRRAEFASAQRVGGSWWVERAEVAARATGHSASTSTERRVA